MTVCGHKGTVKANVTSLACGYYEYISGEEVLLVDAVLLVENSDAFISVTAAEVTPDLKYAKVYYSSLMGDKKEVKQGLRAAAGFIRGQIARRMNLRITPEITFVEDGSIEYGAKISKILEGITITDPDDEGEEVDG